MLKTRKKIFFAAAIILTAMLGGGAALASADWIKFVSQNNLYSIRTPEDPKVKTNQMRTAPGRTVYSEEAFNVIDQRPYKEVIKNYILKYDQTLGTHITHEESLRLIEETLDLYEDHYATMGGVLNRRTEITGGVHDYPAAEIFISYDDPERGPQGVRARAVISNNARIQQIFIGPPTMAYVIDTKNFFDSLQIGRPLADTEPVDLTEKWIKHTSPLQIFTALSPPVTPVYMPHTPQIESAPTAESFRAIFFDPARSQNLFYNIYSYRLDEPLSSREAETMLFKSHVSRYNKTVNPEKLQRSTLKDKTLVFKYTTNIPPSKSYPYMNAMHVKLWALGRYVAVQEILGNSALTEAPFAGNLMENFYFHPLQAHNLRVQEEKMRATQDGKQPDVPQGEASEN